MQTSLKTCDINFFFFLLVQDGLAYGAWTWGIGVWPSACDVAWHGVWPSLWHGLAPGVALLLQFLGSLNTLILLLLVSNAVTLGATGVCRLRLLSEEPVVFPELVALQVLLCLLPAAGATGSRGAVGVEGLTILSSILYGGDGVKEAPLCAPVAWLQPQFCQLSSNVQGGGGWGTIDLEKKDMYM